jgi:hypothetical protein
MGFLFSDKLLSFRRKPEAIGQTEDSSRFVPSGEMGSGSRSAAALLVRNDAKISKKRRAAIVPMLCLLSACAAGNKPFGKPEGDQQSAQQVAPPVEAFKQAGPGAEKELDYETIYGPGVLPPDSTVALNDPQAAPAASTETKPKAGGTQIAAVAVVPVRGAPGKGNAELTEAMRRTIRSAGWPVLDAPREDALTISGSVALAPPKGSAQTVSLSWTVSTFKGGVLGTIKQSNDVPAGSLDKSWGKAADYATEAGATGIYDLIKKYR